MSRIIHWRPIHRASLLLEHACYLRDLNDMDTELTKGTISFLILALLLKILPPWEEATTGPDPSDAAQPKQGRDRSEDLA